MICGQISSCALFVPVIWAATQARGEGYFRLEWKLAVDRSHLMTHDQPFLLTVVIGATKDGEARVPPEFRARVKKLLDGEAGVAGSDVGVSLERAPTQTIAPVARMAPAHGESVLRGARHTAGARERVSPLRDDGRSDRNRTGADRGGLVAAQSTAADSGIFSRPAKTRASARSRSRRRCERGGGLHRTTDTLIEPKTSRCFWA